MTILRSCHRLFGVFALSMLMGQVYCADIYAYVDTDGKLLISDKKDDPRYVRFDRTRRVWNTPAQKTAWSKRVVPQFRSQPMRIHNKALFYTPLINGIAQEVGVNADLLHAIIQTESAYNPAATSHKGAQGLMQLIPATAQRFGVTQSYDPQDNIRGGARYIKNLLALFNNDLQLALAAYNAGEGAVQKYNNTVPPYPETQAYVSQVFSLFKQRGE